MSLFDDEDDPFGDKFGDFNPPFDPFGDNDIVPVQSPVRTTQTTAPVFPLVTTPDDRLGQHALHSIFVDGGDAEAERGGGGPVGACRLTHQVDPVC